jgi:uncharacterized protein (TIGR02996 family)
MARKRSAKKPAEVLDPPMTEQERAELDARLARMVTKPNKSGTGDAFFLLWLERTDEGSSEVMVWRPETEAEVRAANLFHDAAHGLGAFAKPVARGKPVRRSAEHNALIAGVLANRSDDTGSLAYADYLTEHGDPQGDFIRVVIELERLPPDSPEREAKTERMNELAEAHMEEWFAPLGELGLRPEIYGTFAPWFWLSARHGVIEELSIDRPGILPESATRLFAAAPFLRKLAFEKGHLDATGLAKVKQLAQIEELELGYTDLTGAELRTLLRSKHLTGLKALHLAGNQLGNEGARALIGWRGLSRLESLDVSSCEIDADTITALLLCESVKNLTRLRIGRNTDPAGAAKRVLQTPHLKQLTELDLSSAVFDTPTESGFGTAAFAKTLRHLDLDSATFPPDALASFTRSKLPALQVLRLNSVTLRAPGAALLARAAWRGTLTELHLDVCELGPVGVEALATGAFPKLTHLDLSRNRLGNRGGVALEGAAKCFPALTNLRLWDNHLGAEAVEHLAKSKLLANLTDLDINDNKITPAGALALAESKYLTKLTSLTVDEKTVGKKGKQALLDRFGESVVSFR